MASVCLFCFLLLSYGQEPAIDSLHMSVVCSWHSVTGSSGCLKATSMLMRQPNQLQPAGNHAVHSQYVTGFDTDCSDFSLALAM